MMPSVPKRRPQGVLQRERQYPEPSCPRCLDRSMLQYPCRPRLTRLDSKSRLTSSASSGSSTATSVSSNSPPLAMADLIPRSKKAEDGLSPPSFQSSKMEETLPLLDLELIMYWCTTTYRSMARDVEAEALWQIAIPQLSLRFSALRHGLLALSALQLAGESTSPGHRWRYLSAAREHQRLALSGVRLDEPQDLSTAHCNAHFALCCVLLVFSFAYCLIDDNAEEGNTSEQPEMLDEFMEVFELTRWLVGGMMLTMDRVAAGELYPLVRSEEARPTMPDMSRLVVLSLRRKNEMQAMENPAHEKEVYAQALDHLSDSLEQLMNGGEPKEFAFCWVFRIPVRFQDLVRERQPFALVVLAHYTVILHHLRESWWMGGWGTRILREIIDYLDPEWHDLISWPIDATGCFATES